ncbi:MAG: DUF4160 domain-containing protein [Anaerolineae bacterium]
MPTVLTVGPYRFFFWSYDCSEPRHIHVQRDRSRAKFWLAPVGLADSYGFRPKELGDIERVIEEHQDLLRRKWDEHCGGA